MSEIKNHHDLEVQNLIFGRGYNLPNRRSHAARAEKT
jgi:hypothetical protein